MGYFRWRVSCEDKSGCRYVSRLYPWHWLAQVVARVHVMRRHPWGAVKIGASRPSRRWWTDQGVQPPKDWYK